MDPFRHGISWFIGKVASNLCLVSAMMAYLLMRGRRVGPLFQFRDRGQITRQCLVVAVKEALQVADVESSPYSGHHFWIGTATMAVTRGMKDSTVKNLGQWKSLAYPEIYQDSTPATGSLLLHAVLNSFVHYICCIQLHVYILMMLCSSWL